MDSNKTIFEASDYIKERLEDQIDWYDKKSKWNQRWFKALKVAEFVAAGSIPLLTGVLGPYISSSNLIVGILGALIALLAGILSLYQFQENWNNYRTTCESLKHEKFMFLTRVAPYEGDEACKTLVSRIESLISKENSDWSRLIRSSANKET
jgi:hypothetical protein